MKVVHLPLRDKMCVESGASTVLVSMQMREVGMREVGTDLDEHSMGCQYLIIHIPNFCKAQMFCRHQMWDELVDCELRTCGIGMSVDDAGIKIHK